jgi:hypothetical protein
MITTKQLTGVALLLAGGTCLMAQTMGGAISGSVVDRDRSPLAGVKLHVAGTTLIQPRTVVSDAKGGFRIPLLPPGNYTLTATRDEFITINVGNIRIGQDTVITQNLVMKKVPVAQALVVVEAEAASAVEKGNVITQTNFSSARIEALPTSDRSFTGAADLAPGLVSGRGGGFSVRGGTTNTTNYRVNGADVVDPVSNSATSMDMVVQDNIEDIQVMVSPLHPRNGRALGGSINVTTKSGGNTFTGSLRATLDSPSWNATNVNEKYGSVENLNRKYEVVIGGPIIKDRLWFNVASIIQPDSRYPGSVPNYYNLDVGTYSRPARSTIAAVDNWIMAGPGNGYYWAGDPRSGGVTPGAPYTATWNNHYIEGKVTFAITPDHILEGNITDNKQNGTNTVGRPNYVIALRQLGPQGDHALIRGINYRGVFANDAFLQVHFLQQNQVIDWPTGDTHSGGTGENISMIFDKASGPLISYVRIPMMGEGYNPTPEERGSRSGSIEFKKMLELGGSHEIDLGYDYYQARRRTGDQGGLKNLMINGVAGGYRNPLTGEWLFAVTNWQGAKGYGQSGSGNSGIAPVVLQWVGKDGVSTNENTALYVADLWAVNPNINVFAGWRQDFFKVIDTDGTTMAKTSAPSPRFQVRWDVKGDANHLIDLSVARFNSDISMGFTDFFIKKANSLSVLRGWNAQKVNLPQVAADPSLLNQAVAFVPTSALVDVNNYGPAYNYSSSGMQNQTRGSLSAPFVIQLELGYRRTFEDHSWFRAALVYRDYKNFWAIDKDVNDTNYVNVQNPIDPTAPTTKQPVTAIYNSNVFKRTYHGIELEWSKKLGGIFSFEGNYTWSRLVGNDDGGDSSDGTYMDTSAQALLYNRSLKKDMGLSVNDYAPTGPLTNNSESRARLVLLAIQPLGIGRVTYALALKYNSGDNYSATANAPYDWSKASFTPATSITNERSYNRFYSGRGAYQQNDYYRVDFKVSWEVPLSIKTTRIIGDLMVDNLTNHPLRYGFDHAFQSWDEGTNQLFLNNAAFGTAPKGQGKYYYDSPRSLKFSVGIKF